MYLSLLHAYFRTIYKQRVLVLHNMESGIKNYLHVISSMSVIKFKILEPMNYDYTINIFDIYHFISLIFK